ncbi:hypothetical protein Y032_0010g1166 [Ancylostoma ceylanicum]|uniref:Uncharacterized protein n=1 Tax=Ancylostoma ceylanicum TaxID=53326 RepID=A0A016VHH0_9BILA|nr:hypothetical protein Y032_0010g1166 [Ancylostoma ceylanicum]
MNAKKSNTVHIDSDWFFSSIILLTPCFRLPSSYPREKFLVNQRVGYVRPKSYRLLTTGTAAVRVLIESGDDICAKLTLSGTQDEHDDGVQNRQYHQIMEFTRRLDLVLYREKLEEVMLMHIDVYPDDTRCGSETSARTPSQVKLLNITWSAADEVELLLPVSILTSGFLLPIVCALAYATMNRSRRRLELVGGTDFDGVSSPPSEPIGYLTDGMISTEQQENVNAGILLQQQLVEGVPKSSKLSNKSSSMQQKKKDILELDIFFVHCSLTHSRPYAFGMVCHVGHTRFCTNATSSSAPPEEVGRQAKTRDVSVSCERQDWSWASTQFAVILLPILSLIFSINMLDHEWANDQCFHNYACSVPVWIFTSFNHVFSNIGYIISSVFFLVFVRLRKSKPTAEHGAYANDGLEVSMGLSLMCEALASSIYHICPNSVTYNLDTPFIEVSCVLLMLKLYGNRRMTISPQFANVAVTSVLTLDSIITMSSQVSVVRGLVVAVLNIATIFGICLLLLGPHLSPDFLKSSSTRRPSIFSAVGAIMANAVVTMALILHSSRIETTQVVTVLCILNTFLFLGYYIVLKCWNAEKWCKFSSRCICASVLLWAAALFFFLKEETDWALTAAQSRALNRPCVLLNFFDYHDLWHISSALASLVLLIGVSSLDDDLCAIPTRELSVF